LATNNGFHTYSEEHMSEVYLVSDNWQLAIEFDHESSTDTYVSTIDDYIELGEEECN